MKLDESLQALQGEAGQAQLGEVLALLAGSPERIDLEPVGGVGLRLADLPRVIR